MKKYVNRIMLIIIALIFLLLVIYMFSTVKNNNFSEGFDSLLKDTHTPETSHNVDMPINTYYSCQNMCGPLARCSISGEQCTSDVDCYGCVPKNQKNPKKTKEVLDDSDVIMKDELKKDIQSSSGIATIPSVTEGFIGQNSAGKLTTSVVPTYSTLTTDIGTKSKLIAYKFTPIPKPYYGLNTWYKSFNAGLSMFKKEYDWQKEVFPERFRFQSTYPSRATVTGLYKNNNPLASNDFL
jgi:hypothetical protein